jgi:hypothetical protein
MVVSETNLTMLSVNCMKEITQTCRSIFSSTTHPHLRGYLLKLKAMSTFTNHWFLETSKKFAILPPQEVLLGLLRPVLPTCSTTSSTIHNLYDQELKTDPHREHPMRSIRTLHGRYCFPQWMLLGPVIRANRGNSPHNTAHYWNSVRDIIIGRHTWWSDWPSNFETTWPLTLCYNDMNVLFSSQTSHLFFD